MIRGWCLVCVGGALCLVGCEPAAKSSAPVTPTAPAVSGSGADQSGPTDPDAPTEFTVTESGLKYKILRKSDGKKPTASDSVVAHYRGWLDDGKEFDSSYKRGEPTPFPLNGDSRLDRRPAVDR